MKKKLLALGLAVMTVAMSLVGCSEKAVTFTVTCKNPFQIGYADGFLPFSLGFLTVSAASAQTY